MAMAVVPRGGAFVSAAVAACLRRRRCRCHRSYSPSQSDILRSYPAMSPPIALLLFRSPIGADRRRPCCSEANRADADPADPFPRPPSAHASEAAAADPSPPTPPDPIMEAAGALDIRVGRVIKAWRHPEADSLYVEEVDVGEGEPRTICSGLVSYVPLGQLQDSDVVVLTNLKPRNMRGIKSYGMLMAASDSSHSSVELLVPPEGSVPGERIWFGSEEEKARQPNAATPNQVHKKKIWETVQPHLRTTDARLAALGDRPMRTSAGIVSTPSLSNANIS